jgi:capsular polysaccharide transport system permease protein
MAGVTANNGTSFFVSLQIQLRVLGALLMREIITRYGRDNLGFLWLFFEPMLFTLGVTAFWSAAGLAHSTSLPIVAFALSGYSSVLLWRNCANRASMAIPPNLGLLYHHNVRVLDLFVSRILLEIAGATISFVVLGTLWISLGLMYPPVDPIAVIFGWLYLCWFGAALALVVGALTAYNEVIERLWHTIAYLLFPLSGAAFMVEWLPGNFQEFILWFPMVHGVELLREGFFGDVIRTHYDIPYVTGICLALTLVGLMLVRDAGRRVEVM